MSHVTYHMSHVTFVWFEKCVMLVGDFDKHLNCYMFSKSVSNAYNKKILKKQLADIWLVPKIYIFCCYVCFFFLHKLFTFFFIFNFSDTAACKWWFGQIVHRIFWLLKNFFLLQFTPISFHHARSFSCQMEELEMIFINCAVIWPLSTR